MLAPVCWRGGRGSGGYVPQRLNTSKTAMLNLYTIPSAPKHPDGTVHKTKAEAEAAELVEHR